MNNLTTRKTVLGMLMTLVLAFSVQGTADAISTFTPNFAPEDLNNRAEGDSITVDGFPTVVNLINIREYVSLSVSGGGAKFPNPTDNSKTVTSYTWRETDDDSNDGTNHNDASLPTIGNQTITVNSPGEVTVTVRYTETYDTSKSRTTSVVRTYYVVKDRLDVSLSDTIRLRGVTNGVGYPYDHRNDIQIYAGDSRHNEVTYTFESGSLYIKEGNRYRSLSTGNATSSRAEVWLSMGRRGVSGGALADRPTTGTTNRVIALVTGNGNETTGLYIYGRPQLSDPPTLGSDLTAGRPGKKVDSAITVAVMDEASPSAPVSSVPVTFKVANTTSQGGLLSYPSSTSSDEKIDANNKVLKNPPAAESTLHVRTNSSGKAIVDFEFGSAGGEQVITVTAVGITRTVRAVDTSTPTRDISIRSRKRSNSNIYDIYATVTDNGIETADVNVEFTTISGGELTNTPLSGDPDKGDEVIDITNSVGIAQVIYDPQGASGTLQISVSLKETGRDGGSGNTIRRTFNVRGGSSGGGDPDPPSVTTRGSLNIATSGSGNTRTVTVTASRAGTAASGISVVLNVNNGATLSPTRGPTPLESTLTLPATAGDYVLTATTTADYTGDSETITVTDTLPGSLSITVTGTGATRSVTVTAASAQNRNVIGLDVTLRGTALPGGQQTVRSGTATTITLPTAAGDYTLEAAADGFATVTETITVTAGAPPRVPGRSQGGTLTVSKDGAQVGTQQPILVRATPAPSRNLAFTVTNGGVSVGVGVILTTGTGQTAVTVPTTGLYVLTVSADGYTPAQSRFTAGAQPTDPTTDDAPEPSRIEISGSATYSGNPLNTALDDPLRVRVLDADDDPVADARVVFRVRTGQGRLSQRGNGRAIAVQTDARGYARTEYTPMSASSTLSASVNGVSEGVTFTITTGSAPAATDTDARQYNVGDKIPISLQETLSFTGSRTLNGTVYTCVGPGTCVVSYGTLVKGQIQVAAVPKVQPKVYKTGDKIPVSLQDTLSFTGSRTLSGTTYTCVGPGECVISYGLVTKGEIRVPAAKTTPPRVISPVVLVNAANRPPMLWVDSGGIYALVGVSVQRFAPSVDNALNIAIGGNKIYWTEQTGESSGTINSANLDGTGMKELTAIMAVPMGIAVDTAGSKLYWTNSRGRIQSANLDGDPKITNVLQNLSGPMDIAVARGNLYWTQYDATEGAGNIGITNTAGRGMPKYISTGLDMPMSLAIANAKVYWTEKTGESGGTVNAATLNGAGATQLASILAAPIGIAVDGARSKLYWTNARGRIQSANLDGSGIKNVVGGLGSPGEIVLSNSISAPAATSKTGPSTTVSNKYDINGDGSVDSKDVDVILLAVSAGVTIAKHDVNGDKNVDIKDVMAVNANLDVGETAGAPTLLGKPFSALEVDRLEAQIDLLIAMGDRSPAAIKLLIYLQQLIATARPEKTQLLANYPNPFNPETWMPYELATDTDVRITIYASNGVVVRRLTLGHQTAGYYTDRERAAYWDGRNASGEQVASGLYFYQLETDDLSSLRKMVILK